MESSFQVLNRFLLLRISGKCYCIHFHKRRSQGKIDAKKSQNCFCSLCDSVQGTHLYESKVNLMLLFRVLILVCNGLDPCQNGGSCVDGVNTFSCLCLPGFTGDRCQTDMDECLSEPCKNGGTCSDYVNSYTCKCQAGFDGVHCEDNIDECTERWAARVLRHQCLRGKGRNKRKLQSTVLGSRDRHKASTWIPPHNHLLFPSSWFLVDM